MIDRRKNYMLVLDVETANTLQDPLVYDIGGAITDKFGNIEETFSFVIKEIFIQEKELINTAYYANKIPCYWHDIWNKDRQIVSFSYARNYIINLIYKYNITTIGAYNAYFDRMALNTTLRYLSKSNKRYFFPYNITFICIWNMACQTICQRKTYKSFCESNNLISNHGKNYSTTAENVYRFLLLDTDFTEEHKGLDDVKIEIEIMNECYKSHKKMPYGKGIRRNCWQDVKRVV